MISDDSNLHSLVPVLDNLPKVSLVVNPIDCMVNAHTDLRKCSMNLHNSNLINMDGDISDRFDTLFEKCDTDLDTNITDLRICSENSLNLKSIIPPPSPTPTFVDESSHMEIKVSPPLDSLHFIQVSETTFDPETMIIRLKEEHQSSFNNDFKKLLEFIRNYIFLLI